MTRRYTRDDERRVRRLAVLLIHGTITFHASAGALDVMADGEKRNEPERWEKALEAARHYLRELGRTRT